MSNEKTEPLALLRKPFPANQVSKLPKGTQEQNKCPPNEKRNCTVCGGWHHPRIIHLDYVGHAAVTDRLLDADPAWSWEPLALTEEGLPRFDASGGLWIRLTVCGVTRLGYGHAAQKEKMDPGAREKEVLGDAIRNSAMRFGVALDLWHKGDLHADKEEPAAQNEEKAKETEVDMDVAQDAVNRANELLRQMAMASSAEEVANVDKAARAIWKGTLSKVPRFGEDFAKAKQKALKRLSERSDADDSEEPEYVPIEDYT